MENSIQKCRYKNCNRTWEIKPGEEEYLYCSIECACYDGTFSVTKGWLIDPDTLKGDIDDSNKPQHENN